MNSNVFLTDPKELYLKIFQDFPALIWRAGTDKMCNYFNSTWLEFTGRKMEEEVGNGWAEGVHPDDFDRCLDIYITNFDKREPFMMEYRLKNKFGEYRWIRDYGRPFYDIDNTFLGYIGSCYDITENKENENRLIETNATKDKFFSIISHDLRSPFMGFLGLTEQLKTNIDALSKDEIREFAGTMHHTASRIYSLLNNLLQWSKLQTGKMEYEPREINVFDEVNEVIDLLAVTSKKKAIVMANEIEPGSSAYADPNMVSTILRNLISNAIKFSFLNGRVRISCAARGAFQEISVSDSGTGMPEEMISRLFRIDKNFSNAGTAGEEGTGLGLILCKELAEKNKGNISIQSEFGKGTTITVKLPLSNF